MVKKSWDIKKLYVVVVVIWDKGEFQYEPR